MVAFMMFEGESKSTLSLCHDSWQMQMTGQTAVLRQASERRVSYEVKASTG